MARTDGRPLEQNALAQMRRLAVRRVLEEGAQPSLVMEAFGFCRTTIARWRRKGQAAGRAALGEKIGQGPAPLRNEKPRPPVRRGLLGKDPRQQGFDLGLWPRRIVPSLLPERLGVEFWLTAVGQLLARLDIPPQKPLRRA